MNLAWTAAWLAWLAVILAFVAVDLLKAPGRSYLQRLAGVPAPSSWRLLADRLGPLVAVWLPVANLEHLKQKLTWAGTPLGLKPESFVGMKALLAAAALIVSTLLAAFGLPAILPPLLAALFYVLPDWWLSSLVEKRQKQVAKTLPNMVSLLVTAVRAGVELGPALERIGGNAPGLLGDEIRLAWREMATGRPRAAALKAMADRCGVEELHRFVQTIVTAEERGGVQLAQVLSDFMEDVRDSYRRRLEEAANKLPLKLNGPLIGLIFLPMMLLLMAPVVFMMMKNLF